MSPNPIAINLFNQFDSTMDKVLFITISILTLGLLFSTVYFLCKFNFKFKSFIYISLTGILYIICTTPLLQNIHTDGFSEQPLQKIIPFTTCISLLLIIIGILIYAFITLTFKTLLVSIGDDISIKYTALYIYSLIIVMLLFIISPIIFFAAMDTFI